MRHEHSLDALNFFLADVRQGLGPYLAIYLLTERHWAEDQIGFVMTISTVCGLIVQTPAGALTDSSHTKRAIIAAAALVVTVASIILPFMFSFVLVAGSQAAAGAAEAFSGRRSPRSLLDLWGRARLPAESVATRASITPAMRQRRRLLDLAPYRMVAFGCLRSKVSMASARAFMAAFSAHVADLTRSTGHFNLAQGAVITAQGIGAAVSTSLAGLVIVHAGFSAAFLVLAGIAASGFLLYFFGMPETRDFDTAAPSVTAKRALSQ